MTDGGGKGSALGPESLPTADDAMRPLSSASAQLFRTEGAVFGHDGAAYRTTGRVVGHGGTGSAYFLDRYLLGQEDPEVCIAKVFSDEYLYQLRADDLARNSHALAVDNLSRIASLRHPGLLPIQVALPITDNHVTITPFGGQTLHRAVVAGELSHRRRAELLIGALRGLEALHDAGFLHRDVTLRNILVGESGDRPMLFDFDLSLSLDAERGTYRELYRGRILGSPGFSVPPETIEPELMDMRPDTSLDVFAIGGALFGLFAEGTPYGITEDMWGLLLRIADGVVIDGQSRVAYPDAVPTALRPLINRCLERDARRRPPSVGDVIRELSALLPALDGGPSPPPDISRTLRHSPSQDRVARLVAVHAARRDPSVSQTVLHAVDAALERHGYFVQRSLGRVKGHPIFLAAPVPELVAFGEFPGQNTYPKIVTAIDLSEAADREAILDLWLARFVPVLRQVRQGMLTALYRAVYDDESGYLFLFSELVDDPRFGPALDDHVLTSMEALGLGFFCARQIGRLHEHGIAHNNVSASALMFMAIGKSQCAQPAMVGLVDPSIHADAMAADVRRLSDLVLRWTFSAHVEAAPDLRLDQTRAHLQRILQSGHPGIDELIAAITRGIAAIDKNFRVLREHGGDLEDYMLVRVGHPLYARLWH